MAEKTHIKQHCIYLCTNKVNGKMYIGATNDFIRRINEHKCHHKRKRVREYDGEAKLFYDDIKEYGWNNFKHEIILTCDTFEQREELEKKTIAQYREKYGENMIYNYCKGGRGGQTHDVSGEKNPMYGKHWSDEKKEQIASKLRGKKQKPESVAKRSKPLTIINVNTNEIRQYPSQMAAVRDGIQTKAILRGGMSKDGWKLLNEGQEATESINSEKNTIE